MGSPVVTVVIPVFNMESHLRETLESVRRQTFVDLEAVIVDDCSTDSSPRIVHELMESDGRFRYLRLPRNSNRPAVPRNAGAAQARGKYLAFLDHDDVWHPRKLQRQVAVMDENPDLAMVHCNLLVRSKTHKLRRLLTLQHPGRRVSTLAVLRERNTIQCSSVLMRRSTFDLLGGFDERPELRAIEDYHLWLRLSHSHHIAYMCENLGWYRMADSSTSAVENMENRRRYLCMIGLANAGDLRGRNFFGRLLSVIRYPAAFHRHLVEGSIRRQLGFPSRLY